MDEILNIIADLKSLQLKVFYRSRNTYETNKSTLIMEKLFQI